MKRYVVIIALILGVSLSKAETIGIDITLSYKQNSSNTFVLKTISIDEENEEAAVNIPIKYSVSVNGKHFELGVANTNNNGLSEFVGNLSKLREEGHKFVFTASFEGNEQLEANDVELEISDAVLSIKTEVIDSVNTVYVSLMGWDEAGEPVAIPDVDIYIFVPRMYSLLQVTEAYTSEEGEDEIEFPNDIPGGPGGELKIIGRLDDHDELGTIETTNDTNWGIPLNQNSDLLPRALTSSNAPLWMVITFTILMTGVWGHYLWIIYNLFKIRRLQEKDSPIQFTE